MVQRQLISPLTCLKTPLYSTPTDATRLLRRPIQISRKSRRIGSAPSRQYHSQKVSRLSATSQTYARPQPLQQAYHRPRCPTIAAQCRSFTSSPHSRHGDITPPKPGEERHVTFIDKEGQEHNFEVADGDNLLDIAQANDLEMEGACGGSCACSSRWVLYH